MSKWLLISLVVIIGIVGVRAFMTRTISGPGEIGEPSHGEGEFDVSKLKQGCAGKDCIPSIDNPKFISVSEAESLNQIEDDDVVFAVNHRGVARAYPQRILNWHEIVNETISGDAILISFCPLCGTAIGFVREIEVDGKKQVAEFGVSGKLVNSNLVMYDRTTDTLWQQLGGEAIVGDLAGQELTSFPVDTVKWGDWKKLHPNSTVLSQDTGYRRDYSRYPYGDYEQDRNFLFKPDVVDERLHPKEIVWGVIINGESKGYSDKALMREKQVTDTLGGVKLTVTRNDEGQVRFERADGVEAVPDRSMWFAWAAFNPETKIYK